MSSFPTEEVKDIGVEAEGEPSSPGTSLRNAIKNCNDKALLLSLWRRNSQQFQPLHCDYWLRRVPQILKGKHLWTDREIAGAFQEVAERLLRSSTDSWHLSGLLWAAAKIQYSGLAAVKHRVEERLLTGGFQLEPVDFCLILWAYSQKVVGRPAPGVLQQLIGTVKNSADAFEPMGIATTLWSLAKLGHIEYFRFAEKALRHMIVQLKAGLEAQNISNILWSYGTVGYKPEKVIITALVEQAKDLAARGEFQGQAVANTLWALAKLNSPAEFRDVEESVRSVLAKPPGEQVLKPQEISNVLWSFATLRIRPEAPVVRSVLEYLHARAFECNQSDIAFFLGAFAKLGMTEEFLEAEAVLTPVLLQEHVAANFQPHAISNILQAHGELLVEPNPQLINAMFLQGPGPRKVQDFRPQDTVQCLLAFAELGIVPPRPVLLALVQSVVSVTSGSTHRNASSCAFALGVLARCLAPEVVASPWFRVAIDALSHRLSSLSSNGFGDEDLIQLFQALLLLRKVPGCQLALSNGMLSRAEIAWRHRELTQDAQGATSELQADVARVLKSMGIEADPAGGTTEDKLLRIPIAVPASRLAVEVCGPKCFTTNTLSLTGPTLARRLLLEERGWTPVLVPFFQWAQLFTDADKQAWLTSALSASVTPRTSEGVFNPAVTLSPTRSPTNAFTPEASTQFSMGFVRGPPGPYHSMPPSFPAMANPAVLRSVPSMPSLYGAQAPGAIDPYLQSQMLQQDLLAQLTLLSLNNGQGLPPLRPPEGAPLPANMQAGPYGPQSYYVG